MKAFVSKVHDNPRYAKLIHWGKLITITGSAQVIIQITGFACGILIIRALSPQEYAHYTLANAMLSMIVILSDSGISAGVMAQGAKVWEDRERLGSVLNTGLELRRKFALASLVVIMPILIYLLFHHGASSLTILLVVASIIPAFYASLSDSLLEIVPKLKQNIIQLQRNQVFVSIGRLLMTTLVIVWPFTFIAILAAGLPRIYGNRQLKSLNRADINTEAKTDKKVNDDIVRNVKKILPGALYYCFSSQITIWIISIAGSARSIAEVGALGRLGALLNLFSVIIATLIVPRFAKVAENKKLLLKKFFQILFLVVGSSLGIILLTSIFPQQILYILGKQYKSLSTELILSVVVSCMGLINGTIFSLSISRSYNLNPIINIGVHLLSQMFLILLMDLSTTKNVLIFSIIDCGIIIIMFIANYLYFISKISVESEA